MAAFLFITFDAREMERPTMHATRALDLEAASSLLAETIARAC